MCVLLRAIPLRETDLVFTFAQAKLSQWHRAHFSNVADGLFRVILARKYLNLDTRARLAITIPGY